MPYIRIWVHLIWATKNRNHLISHALKPELLNHIRENAKKKETWLDSVNCVSDHIHLLISLGSEQTISKIAMLIKGESSYWINKNKMVAGKFEWQDEYIALSVSESNLEKVRNYIANQEEHHRKRSYADEYEEFMKKFGSKIINE